MDYLSDCSFYNLFNDLYVTSAFVGMDIWNCTEVVDVGIKSWLYLNLSPLMYISKYSYVEEDTYVRLFGNVIVVPDDVIAPVSTYSAFGLTKGIDSMFNNTEDADVKSTMDPETVRDPVMIAEPE